MDKITGKNHVKARWLEIWDLIGEQILRLPEREQDIILDDLLTAIKNRLTVMERIVENKKTQ